MWSESGQADAHEHGADKGRFSAECTAASPVAQMTSHARGVAKYGTQSGVDVCWRRDKDLFKGEITRKKLVEFIGRECRYGHFKSLAGCVEDGCRLSAR